MALTGFIGVFACVGQGSDRRYGGGVEAAFV